MLFVRFDLLRFASIALQFNPTSLQSRFASISRFALLLLSHLLAPRFYFIIKCSLVSMPSSTVRSSSLDGGLGVFSVV